jgi:hypothetical protein
VENTRQSSIGSSLIPWTLQTNVSKSFYSVQRGRRVPFEWLIIIYLIQLISIKCGFLKTRAVLPHAASTHAAPTLVLGERAIVVGGGLAGLSAARALSDRVRQVVILGCDELSDGATPRPGVPQGKHPHGLLGGGLKALEQLFPGFGNELGRAGAVPINRGFDMLYEIPGQDPWPRVKFGWPTSSPLGPSQNPFQNVR